MDVKIYRLEGLAPRRKAAGYTQETFADALGVQRSALAAWETGVSCPRAGILPALADLLLCSIEDLYRAPEEPAGEPEGEDGGRGKPRPYRDIILDREEKDHAG